MSSRSPISAWLDPMRSPRERPALAQMGAATRELHEAIAANAPYLHPEQRTIQRDLGTSATGIAWQEAKAAFTRTGGGAWSALPHLYARYGTPGTSGASKNRRRRSSRSRSCCSARLRSLMSWIAP